MLAIRNLTVSLATLTILSTAAFAQDTVLILETEFDGVGDATQDRFRDALHEGVNSAPGYTVLTEGASRNALGDDADRFMQCGGNATCLGEAGAQSGAELAVSATVSEAGEIYTFTIDVYTLDSGDGVYFTDSECVLCTLEEAVTGLSALGEGAAQELPPASSVEPPVSTTRLVISVEPTEAQIWLNDEEIGQGSAEVAVEPGNHTLRVTASGFQPLESEVAVYDGDEDKEITVRLREDEPGDGARAGGLLGNADTTAWGSVLVGTGLVAAVTGIVLIQMDGETTCGDGPTEDCPEVFSTRSGGTALTVVGSATLATGIIFLLWDTLAGEPAPAASDTAWGVGVTPEGGGVVFGGTF